MSINIKLCKKRWGVGKRIEPETTLYIIFLEYKAFGKFKFVCGYSLIIVFGYCPSTDITSIHTGFMACNQQLYFHNKLTCITYNCEYADHSWAYFMKSSTMLISAAP